MYYVHCAFSNARRRHNPCRPLIKYIKKLLSLQRFVSNVPIYYNINLRGALDRWLPLPVNKLSSNVLIV